MIDTWAALHVQCAWSTITYTHTHNELLSCSRLLQMPHLLIHNYPLSCSRLLQMLYCCVVTAVHTGILTFTSTQSQS